MSEEHQSSSDRPAVLIATLGTEPQVVSAVFDLLTWKGEKVQQIRIVHARAPGTPIADAVHRIKEWGRLNHKTTGNQVPLDLVAIKDQQGKPVSDIRNQTAAQAAFRTIYNQIRLRKREGYQIHLSLAGGRKTMAVYAMLSAQLLFDDADHVWHLHSEGDFLASKRLHPRPSDCVELIPIPVVRWSRVAPILLDLAEIEDPYLALEQQQQLKLNEEIELTREFVEQSLSSAEERVVSLLVKEGLSDKDLGERLSISPRTVEQHLRSAYAKAESHWGVRDVSRSVLITLLNLYYSTQIRGNPP